MNFAELKTELSDRGFAHLSDARLGVYINNARAELDRMFLWPYREASVTGVAPLTVTDLGLIEAVVNTSQSSVPLSKVDYRTLLDNYGDLSTAGTPSFYYVAWPAGVPEVATYPTSSDVIGVQYWSVPSDLTGTQTPAAPAQFHYLIVDLAVRRANRDAGNDTASVQPEIDNAVAQMLEALPPGQADGPDAYVGYTGASEDG